MQQTLHSSAGTYPQRFCIQSLEEADALAERTSRQFADQDAIKLGMRELLINSIEHGNLGISYDEKGALLKHNSWHKEVERRLSLPEFARKSVRISIEQHPASYAITITDDGDGFDWHRYTVVDCSRLGDTHGRGITLARLFCFDTLEYRGNGNEVRCTKTIHHPLGMPPRKPQKSSYQQW